MEPYMRLARTVITTTFTGDEVTVPAPDVEDWQFEVANLDTYLGLADWYVHKIETESE